MNPRLARLRRIALADRYLANAKRFSGGPEGYLSAKDSESLWGYLRCAETAYRYSDLGLLSDRVGFFARRVHAYRELTNVRELWEKFDRLNAAARLSCEEGRK